MSKSTLGSTAALDIDTFCSICLSTLSRDDKSVSTLRCGHCFHPNCITEWEKRSIRESIRRLCPNCRQPIAYLRQGGDPQASIAHKIPAGNNISASGSASNNRLVVLRQPQEGQQRNEDEIGNPNLLNLFPVVLMGLLGLAAQTLIVYFFINNCGDLFTSSGEYPAFSVGIDAKGYIAIGVQAKGIICIGVVAQGLFSLSMAGTGLVVFVGQVGGSLGLGIYQVGVSWFCLLAQLTISLWDTRRAQCGINIFGPLWNRQKKRYPSCSS